MKKEFLVSALILFSVLLIIISLFVNDDEVQTYPLTKSDAVVNQWKNDDEGLWVEIVVFETNETTGEDFCFTLNINERKRIVCEEEFFD